MLALDRLFMTVSSTTFVNMQHYNQQNKQKFLRRVSTATIADESFIYFTFSHVCRFSSSLWLVLIKLQVTKRDAIFEI